MAHKLLYPLFIIFIATLQAQTPCVNGMAGEYPCKGYDLMSFIPISVLANANLSVRGNAPSSSDVWGWTDPVTKKEYAIAGMSNSTAFVDITDPVNPIFLGRLDSNADNNFWRDIKIYNNHAFIVADIVGNHGMQVFDLTRLRNITTPQTFTADAIYTGVESCHNIVINESKGVAYLVGCRSNNGGGPIFIDISTPKSPTLLGSYTSDGYSHDAQVITYQGPDTQYHGKEIYIGSNENEVVILDVTDKSNVTRIATIDYPQIGYTHQGWFTEDHKYFILGDETDEQNYGMNTRTLIFDVQDLDNPTLSSTYLGSNKAIDHNGYTKGNEFFLSNYTAGMRVLDISTIADSSNPMTEIAYFDTFPAHNNTSFSGVWSVYPYFESGTVIINDINRGLFIVKKNETLSSDQQDIEKSRFSISPNPTNINPTITGHRQTIESITVFNILGKKIFSKKNINQNSFVLPIENYAKGIYLIRINQNISKKLVIQ